MWRRATVSTKMFGVIVMVEAVRVDETQNGRRSLILKEIKTKLVKLENLL